MVRDMRDQPTLDRDEVAQRINDLSATELLEFVQEKMKTREMTKIVRQLNRVVLSKTPGQSEAAQQALSRIGFAD